MDHPGLEPIVDIAGVYWMPSTAFPDRRGWFLDVLNESLLDDRLARRYRPRQVSVSHSHRDVVRGLHYSVTSVDHDFHQTVTCVGGEVIDALVDVREGSPTFLRRHVRRMSPATGGTLLMPPGVAHGFRAVVDDSVVVYTMTRAYPGAETRGIRFDEETMRLVGAEGVATIQSDRDRSSRTLDEARDAGLLPVWADSE